MPYFGVGASHHRRKKNILQMKFVYVTSSDSACFHCVVTFASPLFVSLIFALIVEKDNLSTVVHS